MLKDLRFIRVVLVVVLSLSLLVPTSIAQAYSTPYFTSRLPDNQYGPGTQAVVKNNHIYVAVYGLAIVYKMELNGSNPQVVAGIVGQTAHSPDGSIAAQNPLDNGPTSIDVSQDGTVYIALAYSHYIRAVLPDGTLRTIAGNGTVPSSGADLTDASDATQTSFWLPIYLKIGPDGNLYTYDTGVVRRILPDGSTDHVAGCYGCSGSSNPFLEGGVASEHAYGQLQEQTNATYAYKTWSAFDWDSEQNMYVTAGSFIYKINKTDGTIHTYYATTSGQVNTLEDQPLSQAALGSLYDIDISSDSKIWIPSKEVKFITMDDKIVHTAAGGASYPTQLSNNIIPGNTARLSSVSSVSVSNDGEIYYIGSDGYAPPTGWGGYIGKLAVITDPTPPIIQGHLSPSPNAAGWNNSDVTVTWDVTENESPVLNSSNCGSGLLSNDTISATYTCTATSVGGTNSQSVTVKLDKTIPTTSTPLMSGGVNLTALGLGYVFLSNTATISANVTDGLSGVTSAEYFFDSGPLRTPLSISGSQASSTVSLSTLANGQHTLNVLCRDAAGNVSATASTTFTKLAL